MRPVNNEQRKRLLTCSALLCAIPLCLSPLAGRSSFELESERAAFNARFSALEVANVWKDQPVSVARDPFVPETSPPDTAAKAESGSAGIVGMHVTQGESIGLAMPPNRAGAPIVSAIVTGPSSRALVSDGERVRVVRVGDMLAGSRVASIDGSGVHLQSGLLLPLSEEHL